MADGDIVVKLSLDDGGYKIATVNAGRLMNELKRTFESAAVSVKRLEQHQDSVGRKFRDLVLTLGNLRFVAMDINDIFLRLPMSMLKTAGELEKMQQLMTGLSKETDKTKARLEGLSDFNFVIGVAKNAPFDIKALSDSFVKLKTAGIDPTAGSMQALIDSVARFGGNSESLKRASVAIQQMAGKGVISMEELRQQLGEAVPTAMKSMADGLEMTVSELSDKVSKGMVVAGPALEKMFLRMQIENAGAAAEMMTTWVGMTARLKTEWDLTAQHIVNNGFGDAAKVAVQEITNALQGEEFKKFGADFGKGLGAVISDALTLTKILIDLREEIGLAVKVWLAYKAVTAVIAPLGRAIENNSRSIVKSMRDEVAAITQKTKADRDAAIISASNAKYAAEERERTLRSKLDIDQKELASVRVRNAAVLAEERRLQTQLAAMRVAESTKNVNNIGAQQRVLRDIDALAKKNSELITRQTELQRSTAQTRQELNAASAAAKAKVDNLRNLTAGMGFAAVATNTAAVATRAFGAAVNFLGGPIGALLTMISLVSAAWFAVKQRADEAKAAQDRAANKSSVEGDVEKLEVLAKEAEGNAERLRNAFKIQTQVLPNGSTRTKNRADVEREQAEYNAAQQKALAARQAVEDAKEAIMLSGAKRRAENLVIDIQSTASKETNAAQQRVRALQKNLDDLEKTAKTDKERNAPDFKQKKSAIMSQQAQILLADYDSRIEIVKKKSAELFKESQNIAQSDKERIRQNLEANSAVEAEISRLEAEREGLLGRMKAGDAIKPGKVPKVPGANAVEKDGLKGLIDKLALERVQLVAELKGFEDEVTPAADKAQAAYAEVMELWRQGELNITKGGKLIKKPTEDQARQVAETAKQQELMKKDIKDKAKAVKDVESVTDYINGMLPSYQDAMEALLNPLETSKKGAKERSVDKWMAENGDKIRSYAEKQKSTAEAVTAQIRNMAQLSDMSGLFTEMARETKELNDGMVSDSRDAARARAAADNERHRIVMQNLIDERKKAGATPDEVAKWQGALDANTSGRSARLAQEFKSPLEKLADSWENTTENMRESSAKWATGTADALTELVMAGKADFKSLANSIIADLIRIQIQKAMVAAISSVTGFFGFADGGIMSETGSMPLKKYATGGIAKSPQLALFGEGSMPEAYVPLPDGRTIPVTVSGGAGRFSEVSSQTSQNVEINITVHQGGGEYSDTKGDQSGAYRQLGERIKGVVREELTAQKRPGGMLYS